MRKYTREETERYHAMIMDMYKNNYSLDEIAKATGYKKGTVKQYIYSQGDFSADRKRLIEVRNKKIHELYKEGLSMRQIGLQSDCSCWTVKLVLEDVRMEAVPTRRSKPEASIDNPEKEKREATVVEVPKVLEKVMVVENGRYVEKVKVFRDITELCGQQKVYMERRLV